MPTILETLVVKLAGDGGDYDRTLKEAAGSLDTFETKAKNIGGSLTTNVTLPLVALGGAAIKFSTDLNAGLGNIQSLGIAESRVLELKTGFQDLAIATGKSTDDIVAGGYEVISTWGDTADTLEYVDINARAAAAGLSTTQEAIKLTSAVTKGYGDTSVEATQKAADLAFQTVNLGQTTFPELAASMGKVVPIAAALGVSQEELFAQMATLTGVTGGAAEVSTQLRAAYQAVLAPTSQMGDAMATVARQLDNQGQLVGGPLVDAWHRASEAHKQAAGPIVGMVTELANLDKTTESGAARARELESALKKQKAASEDSYQAMITAAAGLGPTIVESVGLTDALALLSAEAGGNTDVLQGMFGSVEALTAVLALSGGQADAYKDKLAAMQDVTGAVDKAFTAQTEGLNANGFTMAQAAVKAQVLMQKLGDGLAPALSKVLDVAGPWVDKLIIMADWFANADAGTQGWILGLVGLLAAAGPVITIIGTLAGVVSGVSGLIAGAGGMTAIVGGLGTALTVLTGPVGWIIAAVAALAIAWSTDFLGIRTKTEEFWAWLVPETTKQVDDMKSTWQTFSSWWQLDNETKMDVVKRGWGVWYDWFDTKTGGSLTTAQGYWESFTGGVQGIAERHWETVKGVTQIGVDASKGVLSAGLLFMQGDWEGGLAILQTTGETAWASLTSMFSTQIDAVKGFFTAVDWAGVGDAIMQGVAGGITSGLNWITDAASGAAQSALDAAKGLLGISSPSKVAASEVGEPFSQGVGVGAMDAMPRVADRIQSALQGLMSDLTVPQPTMAGVGSGGITLNIYLQGGATYEDGRALGAGVDDEMRARGLA